MADARSSAAGGAATEAARKRRAAYGVPVRPNAAQPRDSGAAIRAAAEDTAKRRRTDASAEGCTDARTSRDGEQQIQQTCKRAEMSVTT